MQKLSKKGWVCKTWEGEMAMVTMPVIVAEKFVFTVPDDGVAAKINAQIGKRVSLNYEEHKWIPFLGFGGNGVLRDGGAGTVVRPTPASGSIGSRLTGNGPAALQSNESNGADTRQFSRHSP